MKYPVYVILSFKLMLFNTTFAAQGFDMDVLPKALVQVITPASAGPGVVTVHDDNILILTSRNVVNGYYEFLIATPGGIKEPAKPEWIAELYTFSPDFDVAMLKITGYANGHPMNTGEILCKGQNNEDCISPLVFENSPEIVSRGDVISVFTYPASGGGGLMYGEGVISSIKYAYFNNIRKPVWLRAEGEIVPCSHGGIAVNNEGKIIGVPISRSERSGSPACKILSADVILASLEKGNALASWEDFPGFSNVLDYRQEPVFGIVDLMAGFLPDPWSADVTAGGSYRVSYLGKECSGFSGIRPDYRLNWNGNTDLLLILFFANELEKDATMIIKAPDGSWHCNDDAYEGTLDPGLWFSNPLQGRYDIWIGGYYRNDFISGTLLISEGLPDDQINLFSQ